VRSLPCEHVFPRIVILVLAVALAVGYFARPSGGAGPETRYVVKAADTLWSIAAAHYAGDPREGVWKLERRNRLHSTMLRPGQTLVLP
jgi:nucleoid-associated protein YgaU